MAMEKDKNVATAEQMRKAKMEKDKKKKAAVLTIIITARAGTLRMVKKLSTVSLSILLIVFIYCIIYLY